MEDAFFKSIQIPKVLINVVLPLIFEPVNTIPPSKVMEFGIQSLTKGCFISLAIRISLSSGMVYSTLSIPIFLKDNATSSIAIFSIDLFNFIPLDILALRYKIKNASKENIIFNIILSNRFLLTKSKVYIPLIFFIKGNSFIISSFNLL